MTEAVKKQLDNMYDEAIQEAEADISNNRLWELSYQENESVNPFSENIELMTEYIEILNALKNTESESSAGVISGNWDECLLFWLDDAYENAIIATNRELNKNLLWLYIQKSSPNCSKEKTEKILQNIKNLEDYLTVLEVRRHEVEK